MYWYVVVSGTLDMLHVDSRDDKKVWRGGEGMEEEGRRETLSYGEILHFNNAAIDKWQEAVLCSLILFFT